MDYSSLTDHKAHAGGTGYTYYGIQSMCHIIYAMSIVTNQQVLMRNNPWVCLVINWQVLIDLN